MRWYLYDKNTDVITTLAGHASDAVRSRFNNTHVTVPHVLLGQ